MPGEKDSDFFIRSCREACIRAGLKFTHQRLKVFLTLVEADDHPSAESVFNRLRGEMPSLSLDTVYRTLNLLEEVGLVRRIKSERSLARFEANIDQHHHFICNSCGRIIDFEWEGFDQMPLPDAVLDYGSVSDRSVTLSGTCLECGRKKQDISETDNNLFG